MPFSPPPEFTPAHTDPAAFLLGLLRAALDVANPAHRMPALLPPPPAGRTVVVGAGKAAAAMAAVVEAHWPAAAPLSGLVVTQHGYGLPNPSPGRVAVVEAAHPVPDATGQAAAARMLDSVRGLGPDDLVLALISGGGSALMALPAPGLTLADKGAVTRALLACGAAIDEINCVRKHLSAVKGGRLAAAAAPATVVTLAISDVPGDDPAVIASGPTVPDPTTCADALAVLARHGLTETAPPAVLAHLRRGDDETPKPGDPRLARGDYRLVVRPLDLLEAAAAAARAAGVTPLILGDAIEGSSAEVARAVAGIARCAAVHGHPLPPPCVLLAGGETTVTVRGRGRGGRNTEFVVAFGLAVGDHPRLAALSCGTDGLDGTSGAAGGLWRPGSMARARALGVDLAARLADNDSAGALGALDALVDTGPTRTNVNDFRAVLVR